jgi:hypothetical protein
MMEALEFVLLLEEFQWILYGRLRLTTEACIQGVVIGERVVGVIAARGRRHGRWLL